MRPEAVDTPDALHAADAHPAGRRHRAAAPVRRFTGRLLECHLHHALDHVWNQGRDA